jgi:4-carboxymuconolactone decarboxylase
MPAERSERFRRGLEMIRRMFPNAETRDHPVAAPVRRDWGLYTVETVMGEVWSRPGLSPRDRSAITIAALTALHYPNELRLHLRGALRNGLSHQELSEVILHMRAYAGAPAALEGLMVAEEVFQELPQPDAPA